jgi:hypothetical protein
MIMAMVAIFVFATSAQAQTQTPTPTPSASVSPTTLEITTKYLQPVKLGDLYATKIEASETAEFSGKMPDGMTLHKDGNISGASKEVGDFTIRVTATTTGGTTTEKIFYLRVTNDEPEDWTREIEIEAGKIQLGELRTKEYFVWVLAKKAEKAGNLDKVTETTINIVNAKNYNTHLDNVLAALQSADDQVQSEVTKTRESEFFKWQTKLTAAKTSDSGKSFLMAFATTSFSNFLI